MEALLALIATTILAMVTFFIEGDTYVSDPRKDDVRVDIHCKIPHTEENVEGNSTTFVVLERAQKRHREVSLQ
jgi:hypothetical protein